MKKIIKIIVSLMLIINVLPFQTIVAETENYVSDTYTLDAWKEYFSISGNNISTEHAGHVWTDKSVFTEDEINGVKEFKDNSITLVGDEDESFLVSLSAIASNSSVAGRANLPTDTMFVLDLSSSMYRPGSGGSYQTIVDMLGALNKSITTLLSLNSNNRVGVVIYYGGETQKQSTSAMSKVLLPLDRYSQANNKYIVSSSMTVNGKESLDTIGTNANVIGSNNKAAPIVTLEAKNKVAGTYTQLGILNAMNTFIASSNNTIVPSDAEESAGETRTPIFVLMSDGEPTAATNNYSTVGNAVFGNNTLDLRSPAQSDFVTQLTAAYAKAKVDAKYVKTEPIFYTLSLGGSISLDVMNPEGNDATCEAIRNNASASNAEKEKAQINATIDDYWDDIITKGKASFSVRVTDQGDWYNSSNKTLKLDVNRIVNDPAIGTFPKNKADKYYVDLAFTAENRTELDKAFTAIVDDIIIRSRYNPTLVEKDAQLDGYVSFVDKIGKHMHVNSIKGLLIDGTLYSGALLSKNFVDGGGDLGTFDAPKPLGDELVWSIQQRLGFATAEEVIALIANAYNYKQLSYTSDQEFSNYVGWYANADHEFLGYYNEGTTTLPEVTGNVEKDPVYIIKSYVYLGAVDYEQGMRDTDMMYATIRIVEEIATGEQQIEFAIPSALIPIISYDIKLDLDNLSFKDLSVSGAKHPIRLVYEVELDEEINEISLANNEIVSNEYKNLNTDPTNGKIYFYSNQYEKDKTVGYQKVNSYSYFVPSKLNEVSYYQTNTDIYGDNQGTLYASSTKPSNTNGTFYAKTTIYKKLGSTLEKEDHYHALSDYSLDRATQKSGTTNWYIPKGTLITDGNHYINEKADPTLTDTLPNAFLPYVDVNSGHAGNNYRYVLGSTLGNNGRIAILPETGIRISKTVSEVHPLSLNEDFTFTISNGTEINTTYNALKIKADGSTVEMNVSFNDQGNATITLQKDEELIIRGMDPAKTYEITEANSKYYLATSLSTQSATTIAQQIVDVDFTNTARGYGNLIINKDVNHLLGPNYVPGTEMYPFEVKVSLTLNNEVYNGTFDAEHTGDATIASYTTTNGEFIAEIRDNEQVTILNLPEGVVATIEEINVPDYFNEDKGPVYKEDLVLGDGVVTIVEGETITVTIENTYKPIYLGVIPSLTISGTKSLKNINDDDVNWGNETFTFNLERYNPETQTWTVIHTPTINKDNKGFKFDLDGIGEKYNEPGTYSYRIYEVVPQDKIGTLSYDSNIHEFSVIVEDPNMEGYLQITNIVKNPNDTNAEFVIDDTTGATVYTTKYTNRYTENINTDVIVNIQKLIEDNSNSALGKDGYEFKLYTDDVCQNELTTSVNGVADIMYNSSDVDGKANAVITFDEVNQEVNSESVPYTFYLKEVAGNKNAMTYDSKVIKVEVDVTYATSNALDTSVKYYEKIDDVWKEVKEVTFTNTYDPEDVKFNLTVNKVLTGRDTLVQANEFSFALYPIENDVVSTTAVATGTTLAQSDKNTPAQVVFTDLVYSEVGTYYYQLKETSLDANGITVDKTLYNIKVTITNEDGQLVADYKVLNQNDDTITFTNTYKADLVRHVIDGTKVLLGKSQLNDEFEFIMQEADAQGNPIAGGNTYTALNTMAGTFAFEELEYTSVGTYYYLVKENGTHNYRDYITYDATEYLVTISVTDDQVGQLHVQEKVAALNVSTTSNELVFTNTYTPYPTEVYIVGDKDLMTNITSGRILQDQEFTFDLYESDSSWNLGALIDSATNDETGAFEFDPITVEEEGTYYYIVKETIPTNADPSITYDTNIIGVKVIIEDNQKGKLLVTKQYYLILASNIIEIPSIDFENTYTVTDGEDLILEGLKVYKGKKLKGEDFSFVLYDTQTQTEYTAQNDIDGKFVFEPIEYKPEDVGKEFVYEVKEVIKKDTSIRWDDTIYTVHVKVVDQLDGTFDLDVRYTIKGIDASEIVFTNKYIPHIPNVPNTATK